MASFSKTLGTLYALATTSASSVSLGTALDVSTKMGGLVYVRFGRESATAAGAGCNIRLEASHSASADNSWYPFAVFTTAFAACEAEAVSGTVAAGATAITVASTTNLTAGDVIFILNGTIGNSEWARIKTISGGVSVTVEDALVNAATSCTIYDAAEIYAPVAIPEGASRIRCVVDASLFTQACAVEARYSTIDGIA